MQRPFRLPAWVISFIAAVIGGAFALLGQTILVGEYKNKIETLERSTAAYMEFMGEMKSFVGSQTEINRRLLQEMDKTETTITNHIENHRK